MKILIIEDDIDIAGNIVDFLTAKKHIVDFAANGSIAFNLIAKHVYDAIILDINLPGMDGFELCHKLRHKYQLYTPVLMLTARDSLADKTSGFAAGAWDYLVKPFALEELKLRLDALKIKQNSDYERFITVGELSLDLNQLKASRQNTPLSLHRACLQILELMMRTYPAVISREQLELSLWGEETPISSPLRSHIHELRKVIDKPFKYPMIKTIRGVGYQLIVKS